MSSDPEKVAFLEKYVMSSDRLKTTSSVFNEDTEEYWHYSLMYLLSKPDSAKDPQTDAFLKKLEKSPFKDSESIKALLFRQNLAAFDGARRDELVARIREILNIDEQELRVGGADEKKSEEKASEVVCRAGVKALKKGGVEVDVNGAIEKFINESPVQFRGLEGYFNASAVDAIVASGRELSKDQVCSLLTLLKDSPPTTKGLLDLVLRDLKENNVEFGSREIHQKLTVDQLRSLGEMDANLMKDLNFVMVIAGKQRPISDVTWRNNEAYAKAYLEKLRAFARGPLKHATFKALILYNYLRFFEGVAQPDSNADIAAYQAAVYGNDATKKKQSSNPKFPSYDKETLAAYLSLPRRGSLFVATAATDKQAKSASTSVDTLFCSDLFPELSAIGDDTEFVQRALGYFFLKGDLTAAWPMVNKDWALLVFAKEKLMANAGTEKFLKAQENAIRDQASPKAFKEFSARSELRLFETNKKVYKVSDAVVLEYFTKNNPEVVFNIYQLNSKNYYAENLSEIPTDISLAGAVPLKSVTKKYKDKSILRRPDSVTIKSLADRRGIFVIDLIGKNIQTRAFIRKGELRFIYEQTDDGYDVYVFDENYKQVLKPRIYMDGVQYDVCDEKKEKEKAEEEKSAVQKPGKITLPFAADMDRAEQLIIIEDSADPYSAVLRSFRRQTQSYELRGGFYIDREHLLSKQQAQLLIRSNLYLCQEQTSLRSAQDAYVTLKFKALNGEWSTQVHRVTLRDEADTEVLFTVPTNLLEVQCTLNTTVRAQSLSLAQTFKVNGIDNCQFIADVFLVPDKDQNYQLMTVGKNGEVFANETLDVELFHKFFKSGQSVSDTVSCVVTTDRNGLFTLGKLENVLRVRVKPRNRQFFLDEKTFNLLQNVVNVPSRICAKEGTAIRIPFSSARAGAAPVMHIFDERHSSDISKAASYKNGYVVVEKLPPGDYCVYIEDVLSATVNLHISGGAVFDCHLGQYVLSNSRILQLSEETPLQIVDVNPGGDAEDMKITLSGFNNKTRCHVIVTSLLPTFTAYASLSAPIRYPDVIDFVSLATSTYTQTAKCDAEFMYILNRNKKKFERYNGNNLYAPSLLFGRLAPPQAQPIAAQEPTPPPAQHVHSLFKSRYDDVLQESFAADIANAIDTSNVEFLPQSSLVFSNLRPDAQGVIAVPHFKKTDFRCVQIIATDDDNTALLNHVLSNAAPIGADMPTTDVRLNDTAAFPANKHFSPQRKIVCLNQGESRQIEDFTSANYVPLEKLSALFDLYSGLSAETSVSAYKEFEKFRPLTRWNALSETEKLAFYDQYQCNELSYFLFKRDKAFFEATVKVVLQNKIFKNFMDLWLLDDSQRLAEYENDWYLFSTLNTFEQILLCSKSKDKDGLVKQTLKSIEESAALIERNPADDDRIFAGAQYRNRVDLMAAADAVAAANDDGDDAKDAVDGNYRVRVDRVAEEKDAADASKFSIASASFFFKFSGGGGDEDAKDGGFNFDNFDETLMYEEHEWFNVPVSQNSPALIQATRFWKDFAIYLLQDGGKSSFLSIWVGHACSNVNEMLLSLAVTDLALEAREPSIARARTAAVNSGQVTLTAEDAPAILFLEELVESTLVASTVSVHSNYFDPLDPTEILHGEKVDKFVVGTFETRRTYGCRSVITNVSSVEQTVELLLQIPSGAVAVHESYQTKSKTIKLAPYQTETETFYFYFPAPSEKDKSFACFPVHVNKNGRSISYALDERLVRMQVYDAGDEQIQKVKTSANKNSWEFITNRASGTAKDILTFLESNARAYEVDLGKLSSRLASNAKFFDEVTAVLKKREIYDERVWRYALVADKGGKELCEFLTQKDAFLDYMYPCFESAHLSYNPFDRHRWCLSEFAPLISSRTHCDGQIQALSDRFLNAYGEFLYLSAFRSDSVDSIGVVDKIVFTQFLLYQERVAEAKRLFGTIAEKDAKSIAPFFFDYIKSYLMIYDGDQTVLQSILMTCMSWKAKPFPANLIRLWEDLERIVKEVETPEIVANVFDAQFIAEERNQRSPFVDFSFYTKGDSKRVIDISYRNLSACTVNYYSIDLELLFSEAPFESGDHKLTELVDLIYANERVAVTLPKDGAALAAPDKKYKVRDGNAHHFVEIAKNYEGTNVIIEVVATAKTTEKSVTPQTVRAVHPLNYNTFSVQFDQRGLGQCRVVYNDKKDPKSLKKPIAGAYVKVYSKNATTGKAEFYKDGYTDICGRFNYKKLSTNQLANSCQMSMFVQTPNNGCNVVDVEI